jgi:hypothetical protein
LNKNTNNTNSGNSIFIHWLLYSGKYSSIHIYILLLFHVLLLEFLKGFNEQKQWHYWIKTALFNFIHRQRHHKIIHDWCNEYFPAYSNAFIPAIHVKEICRVDASMTIALRKKGKNHVYWVYSQVSRLRSIVCTQFKLFIIVSLISV